jgi:hypothetical protein
MTYFAELSPYAYWPDADEAVNVGWLSAGHDHPVGAVPEGLVAAALRAVAQRPVNRTRGWHRCELCADPDYPIRMSVDGRELALGDAEIRVTDRDGTVYAAPSLVAHYIAEHSYRPPDGFIEALLENLHLERWA